MNKVTLFSALFFGCCAAGLSLLMIHAPERVGPATVLLFPGAILAIIVGGNVHDFPGWLVAVGNFLFYFAVVCLVTVLLRRFSSSDSEPPV